MSLSLAVKDNPPVETSKQIADQLDRLAKLYQIPNWDSINSILLTEWILEAYPHHKLETILSAISRPEITTKVWRLTPDTIAEWIVAQIQKESLKKGLEESKEKQNQEVTIEWTDERLKQWQEAINNSKGFTSIPKLTKTEIMIEGQRRPLVKKSPRPSLPLSSIDQYLTDLSKKYGVTLEQMKELRLQWMREVYVPDRLEPTFLPGKEISFEEWLLV